MGRDVRATIAPPAAANAGRGPSALRTLKWLVVAVLSVWLLWATLR